MTVPVVLFLSKSFPIIGGVERWMSDLVGGLATSGLRPRVALAHGARFHFPSAFAKAHPEIREPISINGTSGASDQRRESVSSVIKFLRPNVVIPTLLADGLAEAALSKTRRGHSIIYPIHELSTGVASDLRLFGPWMDRIVLVDHNARHFYAEELRHLGDRVVCIPCGVATAPMRVSVPRASASLTIGWCGRLQQLQKRIGDLDALCDCFEQKGVEFRVLVAGVGSIDDEVQLSLARRVMKGQIEFLGGLSRGDLASRFYSYLDALIITSDWETGPLVAFEAMIRGVPVVTSNFEGRLLNGALREGENCLVFPVGDMTAAAVALLEIVENPALAAGLVERARQYALEHRSLERMVESWKNLLLEVAESKSSAFGNPPLVSNTGDGRLARYGVPRRVRVLLRKIFRRRFIHEFPGQEWPSYCD